MRGERNKGKRCRGKKVGQLEETGDEGKRERGGTQGEKVGEVERKSRT